MTGRHQAELLQLPCLPLLHACCPCPPFAAFQQLAQCITVSTPAQPVASSSTRWPVLWALPPH